ncbi:MAG TPA: hypothetical protein VJB10_03375 [Candidatus Peribacteraceae bacterium]|nr:hypothetical protein [Candidatus Peribacteraceae bacterium]
MVLPLGSLLKKSVSDFRALLRPLMVGAVVIGLLLGLIAFRAQKSVGEGIGTLIGGMENADGDPERLQDLIMRMQQGDGEAMQKMGEMMGEEGTIPPAAAAAFVGSTFMFIIAMWVISVIGTYYYLVVATGRYMKPGEALRQTINKIISLIALSIWIGVRSFAWVPFIGVVFGIVLMPRFVPAPVLLLRDGKGIFESASMSYARTSGYWGKILGNTIVAMLCGFVVFIALTMTLSVLRSVSPFLTGVVGSIVSQLLFAYFSVFTVTLAVTILENPLVPTAAANAQKAA